MQNARSFFGIKKTAQDKLELIFDDLFYQLSCKTSIAFEEVW